MKSHLKRKTCLNTHYTIKSLLRTLPKTGSLLPSGGNVVKYKGYGQASGRPKRGVGMNPQMKKGLAIAKKGLGTAKSGQKVFRWAGRLKALPPLRQKAEKKAAAKAMRKAEKAQQKGRQKAWRQSRRRTLWRNTKGLGRVFLALRKRYF